MPVKKTSLVSRSGRLEHTTPYDALALVIDGTITFTIGGKPVAAGAGCIVRLPADVPHAVDTGEAARMILIMLRSFRTAFVVVLV